jgi:hypothetical protein
MGICCSARVIPAEDFIQSLMLDCQLPKIDYHSLETIVLGKIDEKSKKITKDDFEEIMNKLSYQNRKEGVGCNNSLYQTEIFEDITFLDENDQISPFHILLALFSYVGHGHRNYAQDFLTLVCRENRQGDKVDAQFLRKSLLTYLEMNLIVVTNSVFNTLVSNNLTDCEKDDLELLVREVYTEVNLNKFFENNFGEFFELIDADTDGDADADRENKLIDLKDSTLLFKNREFIFTFWNLRNAFLDYIRNISINLTSTNYISTTATFTPR